MLCSVCKKKTATVHVTEIVSEQVHKTDLCEDCAKGQSLSESKFSLGKLLAQPLGRQDVKIFSRGYFEQYCSHLTNRGN